MCTAIRVLYGWPSVMRGRRSMRGRRPMAKWIKVDRIRSLQIRRRLAPGARFKRSFECPVSTPRSPMLRVPCGASPRRRRRAEAASCAGKPACGAARSRLLHMQPFRHTWKRRPVRAAGGLALHGTRSTGDRGAGTEHSKERLKRVPGAQRRRI